MNEPFIGERMFNYVTRNMVRPVGDERTEHQIVIDWLNNTVYNNIGVKCIDLVLYPNNTFKIILEDKRAISKSNFRWGR